MFKAVAASKSRGPGDDEPSEGSSPIVLRPDLLLSLFLYLFCVPTATARDPVSVRKISFLKQTRQYFYCFVRGGSLPSASLPALSLIHAHDSVGSQSRS